ncbi:MAG: hypothetical protein U5K55_00780 [Aliarcobacter sp.]|nr:hypothetical protein [Aliarcobacter sp.]
MLRNVEEFLKIYCVHEFNLYAQKTFVGKVVGSTNPRLLGHLREEE